ncbi:hypothetical protein HDU98_006612 [Podochytrium sp. JEL0797]|nr:hypothetical protein HDU98_006612 [Podochytrium sp. JEL0797]
MLHPLYPYMVRTLIPGDTTIGYHTGLLQSAYFLPSIISAPLMGRLSDVVGRRQVLLVGLIGYGCGTLMLGLSVHYWLSVFSMVVTGFFSGNATVAKSVIGELSTDDHTRALGYSAYGIAYALCAISGAVIGGQLADSTLFNAFPFLQQRPYFTACFFGFILAAICIAITFFLHDEDTGGAYSKSSYVALREEDSDSTTPRIRLSNPALPNAIPGNLSLSNRIYMHVAPYLSILNRNTLIPLLLYTLYAFTNSVLHTAIPLISASDAPKGYHLPQKRTAQISMYTALAKLAAKSVFMGCHSVLGSLGLYRTGTGLLLPALVLVSGVWYGLVGLIPGLLVIGVGESWAYLSLVMLITEGAQAHDRQGKGATLGLVHGVSGCFAAIVRTVGPALAGVVWETAGPRVLFGGVGCVVGLQIGLSVVFLRTRRFRNAG